ncbi:hypothetical protein BU17DRAFT_86914 [Hysterangium stoloniferum]|nr:hypothetical protein BU17DRAFT_86914 [Hysterangium stoloniferum]
MHLLAFALALVSISYVAARVIENHIWKRMSAMSDLGVLGEERKGARKILGTAVICGGGYSLLFAIVSPCHSNFLNRPSRIGGLFCARVCSDHFKNVIIVEAEESVTAKTGYMTNTDHKRSHVAQYRAVHQYHMFMVVALRKLFPDFDKEIESRGGRILHHRQRVHVSGLPIPPPADWSTERYPPNLWMSRPAFEPALRKLVVTHCKNVQYLAGTVADLQREGRLVTAVTVNSKSGTESIPAAFVIDCTGLVLGGFRWLKSSIPDKIPFKITHEPKMAYTTAIFDVPPKLIPEINAIGFPDYHTAASLYASSPVPTVDQRTIVVQRKENNIRLSFGLIVPATIYALSIVNIACGGWAITNRITCIEELRTAINAIVVLRPMPSWIQETLNILESHGIEGTYVYSRCPPPSCVQYHRLTKYLPSNFVAVGDSWAAVNPQGAQGCTKACAEAVTLNAHLSRCHSAIPAHFSEKYFTAAWHRIQHVWNGYKVVDYSFPTTIPTVGETLTSADGPSWLKIYMRIYNKLLLKDAEVAAVAYCITGWLRPPTSKFALRVMGKVLMELIRELLDL